MPRTSVFLDNVLDGREVSAILFSAPLAFRLARTWKRTRKARRDPIPSDARKEFADTLRRMALIEAGAIRPKTALHAIDEYLREVSKLETEWLRCGADPKIWWAAPSAQTTIRKIRVALAYTRLVLLSEIRVVPYPDPPFWPKEYGVTPLSGRMPRDVCVGLALDPPYWSREYNISPFAGRLPRQWVGLNKRSKLYIHGAGKRIFGHPSLRQAAQIAALLLFGDVVSSVQKVGYCRRCGVPFLQENRKVFCNEYCAHADSRRRAGEKSRRNANQHRIAITTQALIQWLKKPIGKWRSVAERMLIQESLLAGGHKSQWLGRCIAAAKLSNESPQRMRLIELATTTKTNKGLASIKKQLDRLMFLINKAKKVEETMQMRRMRS